jgi:tetratricopeptide (TPR) repeat protein
VNNAAPETLDPIPAGRALIAGLNIAYQAHQSLNEWEECLALSDEIEQTELAMGESAYQRARTHCNRASPLLRLGRLDEAQRALEDGLALFQGPDSLVDRSGVLAALADVWNARGDYVQAIDVQRQALVIRNRFPDPQHRGASHNNLAIYLYNSGQPGEAAAHQLAAIVYFLVTDHHRALWYSLHGLTSFMRAGRAGATYDLPRLTDLVARPDFDALARFLAERQVDQVSLQVAIDQFVASVRKAITAQPEEIS